MPRDISEHPAALAAREIVTTLAAQGVRDVVLAPGSRSAPLAYALHAAEQAGWLRVHVRIDERVAGFVALGIARERPAAVVTTSGTAVANLHPAVLEAHHSRLPLLVLSADRPHELRGVGANQTTDQPGIFGTAVRRSVEIPAFDGNPRGVTPTIVRAVAAAVGARTGIPGPVQVNIGFRDPLVPAQPWLPPAERPDAGPGVLPSGRPIGSVHPLHGSARTVLVAGDGVGVAAAEIAEAGGWPLLAEPSSGARRGATAIAGYHAALAELGAEIERVLVLGRPTLSRDISRLLARREIHQVVVDPAGDWVDVVGTADIIAPALSVAESGDPGWLARWREAGTAPDLGDGVTAARVLRDVLSARQPHPVVLGSSMTIRHADRAAGAGADYTAARVLANRGLAGIDGTISTATGYALATGAPVRAVVGDLTFIHDVGGLAHGVHEPDVDLQVFVLNDAGGGIFATLEHGRPEHAEVHPRFFGTAQDVDLAALAAGFGAAHLPVTTTAALAAVLAAPVRGRSVVEIRLD